MYCNCKPPLPIPVCHHAHCLILHQRAFRRSPTIRQLCTWILGKFESSGMGMFAKHYQHTEIVFTESINDCVVHVVYKRVCKNSLLQACKRMPTNGYWICHLQNNSAKSVCSVRVKTHVDYLFTRHGNVSHSSSNVCVWWGRRGPSTPTSNALTPAECPMIQLN